MKETQHDELVAMVTSTVKVTGLQGDKHITQVLAGTKFGACYVLNPDTAEWAPLPPIPGSLFHFEMRMAALRDGGDDD